MTVISLSPFARAAKVRPALSLHHDMVKSPPRSPAVEFVLAVLSLLLQFLSGPAWWVGQHRVAIVKAAVLVVSSGTFGTVFGLWLAGAR